jgi:molybdate transport system ATP-binding protein
MLELDLEARVGPLALRARLSIGNGPLALVGPNGAGKTSLLRALLGVRPARGTIALDGAALLDTARGIDLPPERRRLGYLPQHAALFPHLTVIANVEFGMPRQPGRLERALGLLESLEVGHLASRRTTALSGGERQRVALARALAAEPKALLLDEPLAALDAGARRQVRDFLAARLRALALPALVITHDAADACALADRIAVLEQGALTQIGTPAELRAAPATQFVADFFDGF